MSDQAPGPTDVERLCEVMHIAYERAARDAGWATQAASRRPWSDVPEANKATMRASVRALLAHLGAAAVDDVSDQVPERSRLAAWLLNRAAAYRADADHMEAPKTQWHTPVGERAAPRPGSDRWLSPEARRAIAVELETCAVDLELTQAGKGKDAAA